MYEKAMRKSALFSFSLFIFLGFGLGSRELRIFPKLDAFRCISIHCPSAIWSGWSEGICARRL